MMSRMTIKLQRSPSISSVKLIGQPERISFLFWIFFINSIIYHLQYALSLVYVHTTCRMQLDCGGGCMKKIIGSALLGAVGQIHTQDAKTPYPTMASIEQYQMDRDAEIGMARTAAPASISKNASVMVLGQKNYETAVEGTNGFVCLVGRSWGAPFESAEFWNPKNRSPECFNPPAALSVLPYFLKTTGMVLAGS